MYAVPVPGVLVVSLTSKQYGRRRHVGKCVADGVVDMNSVVCRRVVKLNCDRLLLVTVVLDHDPNVIPHLRRSQYFNIHVSVYIFQLIYGCQNKKHQVFNIRQTKTMKRICDG